MPLFEVEGERHHVVPGGAPGTQTTAHRVVESHIHGLLGEQVFPVSPGSGPDEPHLLALDASGAPVVVELVSRLDDDALTRALDHAGAAGRMTRGQLAALYRGGPQAFQRDVAEFYDSVPVTRSHAGRQGARLIIICQDADEAVLNAVDFLRQPTMPVEVLRLGVVHSADGRKLVDVSPLVIHPASAPDKPQIRVAPPAERREVALGDAQAQAEFEEAMAVGLALTGKMPVVVKDPREGGRLDAVPLPGVPTGVFGVEAAAPQTPAAAEPPASARGARPASARAAAAAAAAQSAAPGAVPELRARRSAAQRSEVRRRSRTDRFAPPSQPTPVAGIAVPPPPTPVAGVELPPLAVPSLHEFAPPSEPVPAFDLTDPTPHLEDLARIRRQAIAGFAINPADDPLAWGPDEQWSAEPAPTSAPAAPHGRAEHEALAFGEVFARVSSPLDPEWAGIAAAEAAPPPAWDAPFDARLDASAPAPVVPSAPDPEAWWREEPEPSAWPAMTTDRGSQPWDPPAAEPSAHGRWEDSAPEQAPAPQSWEPPAAGPQSWDPPATGPIVLDEDTDADLIALAARIGVPTPLVWERPRRGQRFDAVLHPDGRIQLPDGFHYRHPDVAASAVSGSYSADGWSVWRLGGPAGPTLEEEFRARFS